MLLRQGRLFEASEDIKKFKEFGRTVHGGDKLKGKRKTKRPVIVKKWHHVILKSKKARGELSFARGQRKLWIEQLILTKAKKFNLVLGDFVNAGNHLHIKVKPLQQDSLKRFLKSVSGLIARKVTGASRGKRFGVFWEGLAYSRVLMSSKEDLYLRGYFKANLIQMEKSYQARESFLNEFRAWVKTLRRRKAYLIDPVEPPLPALFS